MNVTDRAIMTVLALVLAALAALAAVAAAGWAQPAAWLEYGLANTQIRLVIGLVSILVVAASFWLVHVTCRRQRPQAIIRTTELGDVTVNLAAVENLARRVTSHISGVREVKPVVGLDRSGRLWVRVKLLIDADTSVPDVSGRVQKALHAEVRDAIGVEVAGVRVTVDNFADDPRRGRNDYGGAGT